MERAVFPFFAGISGGKQGQNKVAGEKGGWKNFAGAFGGTKGFLGKFWLPLLSVGAIMY